MDLVYIMTKSVKMYNSYYNYYNKTEIERKDEIQNKHSQ